MAVRGRGANMNACHASQVAARLSLHHCDRLRDPAPSVVSQSETHTHTHIRTHKTTYAWTNLVLTAMSTRLRAVSRLPRQLSRRSFAMSARRAQSAFGSGPSPPRLPKEEQEIFERLQKQSTGAFSTPRASSNQGEGEEDAFAASARPNVRMQINQSPDSLSSSSSSSSTSASYSSS